MTKSIPESFRWDYRSEAVSLANLFTRHTRLGCNKEINHRGSHGFNAFDIRLPVRDMQRVNPVQACPEHPGIVYQQRIVLWRIIWRDGCGNQPKYLSDLLRILR